MPCDRPVTGDGPTPAQMADATRAWNVFAATVRDPWPGNGGKRFLSPQEWYNIDFAARILVSADNEDDSDEK